MSILLIYPSVAILITVVVIAVKYRRPNPGSPLARRQTGRVARGVAGGLAGAAAGMTLASLLSRTKRR
ncbi:hypothetical protein ACTWPB_08030 [Nocardia sp. IBHARD005]|uniref:hypothetical protein n=1 Tax=Nocardia sp. IBHARD005 TaxID=3457765 RepID=UPI00405846D8